MRADDIRRARALQTASKAIRAEQQRAERAAEQLSRVETQRTDRISEEHRRSTVRREDQRHEQIRKDHLRDITELSRARHAVKANAKVARIAQEARAETLKLGRNIDIRG